MGTLLEKVRVNPLSCYEFSEEDGDSIYLKNGLTGKLYSLPSRFLHITHYCSVFRDISKLEKRIQDVFFLTNSEAHDFIATLLEKKVLLRKSEYKEVFSTYKKWFFYNWWTPLHYFLAGKYQNLNISDRKNNKSHTLEFKGINLKRSDFYKQYNFKSRIDLPKPEFFENASLGEVLMRRRTSRGFLKKISIQELSNLLSWSLSEARENREVQYLSYKKHPENLMVSLFIPQEIYIVVLNVIGLPKGVYHYNIYNHSLHLIRTQVNPEAISDIAQGQVFLKSASCILFFTGMLDRWFLRYKHDRAYRDLLATTARLAQKFLLFGTFLEMRLFETPAIKDTKLSKLLGLQSWEEEPLYLVGVGK